jgi:hypothetical protein
MDYDAPFSPSHLSIITYYYHTLSLGSSTLNRGTVRLQ